MYFFCSFIYFHLTTIHSFLFSQGQKNAVILLHDNSRPHVAQLTQQKVAQLGWEVLPHPLWSLDLAPSDYHLFLSLRNYLCNKHYEDFDELKSDLTAFFESKPGSFYRRGIELLPERWAKVVENNGDYIVDWCCISLLKNKVIVKSEKKFSELMRQCDTWARK